MDKLISACGLDCLNCECYLATRSGEQQGKEDIAKRWSEIYQNEITTADINCDGCMNEGVHFNWCNHCPIRACVVKRGYKSCAECPDFPCETNASLYIEAPSAKENILKLRS